MNIPQRWQRSREAGAKQPASCRYVGRGTKYGNDYKIHYYIAKGVPVMWYIKNDITNFITHPISSEFLAHKEAVSMFDVQFQINIGGDPAYYDDLLNYEYISCFCALDMPCHCDAIIEHLQERIKVLA